MGAGAPTPPELRSAALAAEPTAPAATADAAIAAWRPNMRTARRYANRRAGSVRFAVVDSVGGLHHHRGNRTAPAASVFKAMLLATYLRDRDVRDRRLTRSDRRLLGPMIRRSDNETATRVRDIVGRVAWLERGRHRISVAILTEYNPSHRYGKRTLEGVAYRLLRRLPSP